MVEPRVQVIALVLSIKYFLENKLSSRNILHSAMHWCLCESWPSNPDVRCSTARIKYLQWSVISTAFVLFTENQYKDKNQRSMYVLSGAHKGQRHSECGRGCVLSSIQCHCFHCECGKRFVPVLIVEIQMNLPSFFSAHHSTRLLAQTTLRKFEHY